MVTLMRLFCRIVSTILVVIAIAAVECPAGALAQEKAEAVEPGDTLRVLAFGRDDLSGSFSVQSDLTLSLPLVGSIDVAGKTPRELESTLSSAWEQRLGAPVPVSVQFLQRAPFYILGAVNSPGGYPYRDQMTILHAVAMAGGFLKIAANDPSLRIDLMRERERRGQATDELAQALASRARLAAERDGIDKIEVPPRLLQIAESSRATELIQAQQKLKEDRAGIFASQNALLQEQATLSQDAIKAYQAQLAGIEQQETLINRELSRVQALRDTGLGLQSRVFDMQQRLAGLSADKAGAMASLNQARNALAAAQNGLARAQIELSEKINTDLIAADETIRKQELILRSSEQVLAAAGESLATVPRPEFRLVRAGGNGDPEVAASNTLIRPGDVIDVVLPLDDTDNFAEPRAARATER